MANVEKTKPVEPDIEKLTPDDDGLTQSERLIKAALELGTNDEPKRFAERVRKLASRPSAKQEG